MSDTNSESGRYIDPDDLEEHDPRHPNIKPHSSLPLLLIIGGTAAIAAMAFVLMIASNVSLP